MKISNTTYDRLKWTALVLIPAIQALWLTIGKVWGFPYLAEVGTTIAAFGLFLATIIGVSDKSYSESVIEENAEDYLEEGEEDDEEDDIQAD